MYFHVVVVQRRQRNIQEKCDARANLFFCFFEVLVAGAVVVAKAPYRRSIIGILRVLTQLIYSALRSIQRKRKLFSTKFYRLFYFCST